jgi:hypothetical protein
MRIFLQPLIMILAAGAFNAPVAGPACQAALLPTLGSGVSELRGGDPSGRYLVGREYLPESALPTAVVWVDHEPRALDTSALLPYVDVTPTDVNRYGTIVGYRMRDYSSFYQDAWVYRDGRFTMLVGLRPTDVTVPTAINSRGDIVGYSLDTVGTTATYHAVVWPADAAGTVRELTVPGQSGVWTMGLDIDEDGTVLGWLSGPSVPISYIWPPDGAPYPLQGPAGVQVNQARAIRNGWVVGFGQIDYMQGVGLRWNLRTGRVQVASTEYPSLITVNNTGTIAAAGAIIHRNGKAVPLGGFIPVVLTDRGTAAGANGLFTPPIVWTGC